MEATGNGFLGREHGVRGSPCAWERKLVLGLVNGTGWVEGVPSLGGDGVRTLRSGHEEILFLMLRPSICDAAA